MDRYKVHWIVGYIRGQAAFPFDVIDVNDGIDEVLRYFGIYLELDEAERVEIRRELVGLASETELAEMARLLEQHPMPELDALLGRQVPPRVLGKGRTGAGVPHESWRAPVAEQGEASSQALNRAACLLRT